MARVPDALVERPPFLHLGAPADDGSSLNATAFEVWLYLIDMEKAGTGGTSAARIALRTTLTQKQVEWSLRRLEEQGFIERSNGPYLIHICRVPSRRAEPGLGRNGRGIALQPADHADADHRETDHPETDDGRLIAAGGTHTSKLIHGSARPKITWRPCICCGDEFPSEGAHHRMCGGCRANASDGLGVFSFGGDGRVA